MNWIVYIKYYMQNAAYYIFIYMVKEIFHMGYTTQKRLRTTGLGRCSEANKSHNLILSRLITATGRWGHGRHYTGTAMWSDAAGQPFHTLQWHLHLHHTDSIFPKRPKLLSLSSRAKQVGQIGGKLDKRGAQFALDLKETRCFAASSRCKNGLHLFP